MKTKTKLKKLIWLIASAFFALFFLFESAFSIIAKADETNAETTETKYTDVLEDLKKDENFDEDKYFPVFNDYSLKVIQIAESSDNELFVYVYQPSHKDKDLTANYIRLAMPAVGEETVWRDYGLTLVSENGVFDKYVVDGVTVKNDTVRYYDIVCIHRPFDGDIDDPADEKHEQTINTMVYEVAKKWAVYSVNGETFFECIETQVVTITSKIVGFIEYDEGIFEEGDACRSHFVAFSCDWEIDRLMEADVAYIAQSAVFHNDSTGIYEEIVTTEKKMVTLKATTSDGNVGGWFAKEYTWQEIESVESFIENEEEDLNLHDAKLSDLKGKQWILRFAKTKWDFDGTVGLGSWTESYTKISNVTILRLKFETDGVVYNLGVVDNMQTGPDDPFTNADTKIDDFVERMEEWFNKLFNGLSDFFTILLVAVIIILLAVIAALLMPVILAILKIVFKVLAWLLKVGWWLLCFPYNVLGKAIKKAKNKKE